MYKFAHLFEDTRGQFYILSNKTKKPNPDKAKFFPFGSQNLKYLGAENMEDVVYEYKDDMIEWAREHYSKNKAMFYHIPSKEDIAYSNMIVALQKKGFPIDVKIDIPK